MRTKTLLLSAVALATGLVSSQAQNVFSANVVGYVSVTLPGNGQYVLVSNPFDDGNGNYLTNIVSGNLPKASQVLTWGGATFNTFQKLASGWPSNAQQLPPGTGFFIRNGGVNSGVANLTNIFVGSIAVANNTSTTNQEPLGYTLQGSPIPYTGNLAVLNQQGGDTNMDFGTPLAKQSQILTWNANLQTYNTVQKIASGWNGTATVNPGDGFFINNKNGPATNVVESLNLQ